MKRKPFCQKILQSKHLGGKIGKISQSRGIESMTPGKKHGLSCIYNINPESINLSVGTQGFWICFGPLVYFFSAINSCCPISPAPVDHLSGLMNICWEEELDIRRVLAWRAAGRGSLKPSSTEKQSINRHNIDTLS